MLHLTARVGSKLIFLLICIVSALNYFNSQYSIASFTNAAILWHWKELRLNFGIREYAFEPEEQNMINSRLIVGCASICMRMWCRICGNNTWMLSANGDRNALEDIVSLHLCCQSYHPFDYSFNFMEISRVIFGNFLFPRQIFHCFWWQNLRKISWTLSVDGLDIPIFAVLQIWFIFYTWYKFCCAYLTTS